MKAPGSLSRTGEAGGSVPEAFFSHRRSAAGDAPAINKRSHSLKKPSRAASPEPGGLPAPNLPNPESPQVGAGGRHGLKRLTLCDAAGRSQGQGEAGVFGKIPGLIFFFGMTTVAAP